MGFLTIEQPSRAGRRGLTLAAAAAWLAGCAVSPTGAAPACRLVAYGRVPEACGPGQSTRYEREVVHLAGDSIAFVVVTKCCPPDAAPAGAK